MLCLYWVPNCFLKSMPREYEFFYSLITPFRIPVNTKWTMTIKQKVVMKKHIPIRTSPLSHQRGSSEWFNRPSRLWTSHARSHQIFHSVLAVKLLGIMLKNRWWPTTFLTITAGDADGWCRNCPVWSALNLSPSTASRKPKGKTNCWMTHIGSPPYI